MFLIKKNTNDYTNQTMSVFKNDFLVNLRGKNIF
jgi:hypothetical protein